MTGAMSESGGDDFYYDDTADFTPDASGNWDAAGGSTQYSGDDAAYFQYAGSGGYSDPVSGGSLSGSMQESGCENTSDNYNVSSFYATDSSGNTDYSSQTADGWTTDTGNDNFSYAASGSYSYSANGGTMSGTASESGGASDSYDFGESMDSSGNWDPATLSGSESGGDNAHRCYAGSGTYSQEVGSATVGSGTFAQTIDGLALSGSMSQSGNDDSRVPGTQY